MLTDIRQVISAQAQKQIRPKHMGIRHKKSIGMSLKIIRTTRLHRPTYIAVLSITIFRTENFFHVHPAIHLTVKILLMYFVKEKNDIFSRYIGG